jgi:dihydrofolate reductase
MSKLRVACYAISLDGYGAGPDQALERPLGLGGERLHDWTFATQTFRQKLGFGDGGGTGVDDGFIRAGFENLGAWILGRNMFSPQRGPWLDHSWKGWWGDEPPYRVPVYVLSHHLRPSFEMAGGTVFHFVDDLHEALHLAREEAQGRDVRVGGGAATIRQYLQTGELDELHLAIAPVLLGRGEPLLAGLNMPQLGYRCVRQQAGEGAFHVVIGRQSGD